MTKNDPTLVVRQNMRRLREEQGLSQTDLAKIVGCKPSNISDLERGRRPGLTTRTEQRIADALGVSRSELVAEK